MNELVKNRIFLAMIYTLLALLILYLLFLFKPVFLSIYAFLRTVLMPFFVAMIISYVLNPIVRLLNERKVPRTAAVLLIYAVFLTCVIVLLMNLIPMFMTQLKELNEHLPGLTTRAQHLVDGFNDNKSVPPTIREGINRSIRQAEKSISDTITKFINEIDTTINILFVAFIIPFLAFYMLKDYQMIEKTALAIVPKKHRIETIKMLIDIDTALGNYIRGQLIVCAIVGGLAYLGYWMIGLPYPLLMASIVAIFNIIPYLGPFLGAAPAIVMAATISWKMMLFVILVNMIVQNLEGNVISPQIVGRKLNLHPLVIIFALLVGGELAGVVGLILAVPFLAVTKVIVHHVHVYYVRHKNP
ncbi:MAG TPA: AI-2E family transporter [Bacilli bacterium]